MSIKVYHGGTAIIEKPRADAGRANLDFGLGFYIIDLYMAGLMTREIALARLSEHRPNNQMCLLNQEIIDKYLIFHGAE